MLSFFNKTKKSETVNSNLVSSNSVLPIEFEKNVLSPILKNIDNPITTVSNKKNPNEGFSCIVRFGKLIDYYKLSFVSYGEWLNQNRFKYQLFRITVDDSRQNKTHSVLLNEGEFCFKDVFTNQHFKQEIKDFLNK